MALTSARSGDKIPFIEDPTNQSEYTLKRPSDCPTNQNHLTDPSTIDRTDVAFFQCKAIYNADAAASVKHLFDNDQTVAISFQNGLGNEEEIERFLGEGKVLGGLTAQGANIEAPGVVRNHAELPSFIGEMKAGVSDRTTALASALSAHGLPTEVNERPSEVDYIYGAAIELGAKHGIDTPVLQTISAVIKGLQSHYGA